MNKVHLKTQRSNELNSNAVFIKHLSVTQAANNHLKTEMIRRAIHLQLILGVAAAANVATTKTIGDVMNEVSHIGNIFTGFASRYQSITKLLFSSNLCNATTETATTRIIRPQKSKIQRRNPQTHAQKGLFRH
jgi:hypothetical protein